VSSATITLCVPTQRVFIVVDFLIDSVRKLLDTSSCVRARVYVCVCLCMCVRVYVCMYVRTDGRTDVSTRVYQKVSGLTAWSENNKW
jgi:hypothetical protein